MDQKEILKHVDHTQLRAFATWEDIQKLCEEAIEYEKMCIRDRSDLSKTASDVSGWISEGSAGCV